MKCFAPIGIFILSQWAWPVSWFLERYQLMGNPSYIFLTGVACLSLATLGPMIILKSIFKRVDSLLIIWSIFSWSCMIDLGIALELGGHISNFVGFYFAEGEPYLMTSHGAVINYYDGTVHFVMYIALITLCSYRKSYRELALVWVGSIFNSMIVLVPGGLSGKHPFKMSILLNTPYVLCPLYALFKLIQEQPSQARTFIKFSSIWKRPMDLLWILYFVFASCFALFSGLAVLGGNAELMKTFLKVREPYLNDPTMFPKWQTLTYAYVFLAYYLYAIYGLLNPGTHRMTDWSLVHAGAAAQAQVTYILGSTYYLTPQEFQSPQSGSLAFSFYGVHLTLLIGPLLFALHCVSDHEKFGRAYGYMDDGDMLTHKKEKTG